MTSPVGRGGWTKKFADAWRGVWYAVRSQKSFWVHVPVGLAVLILALVLRLPTASQAVLILTIGVVLGAEAMNSAIEQIVRVLHPEHDDSIGIALDMAAGGVLLVSIGAALVGLLVLGPPLFAMLV